MGFLGKVLWHLDPFGTALLGALLLCAQLAVHAHFHSGRIRRAHTAGSSSRKQIYFRLVQFNVWYGSRYTSKMDRSAGFSWHSYETQLQSKRRYHSALRDLRALDPDVNPGQG